MKKRVVAIALSLFMVIAMFPLTGSAASKVVPTSIKEYNIIEGNEYLSMSDTYKYNKKGLLTQNTYMYRDYYNYNVPPGTENDPDDPYYRQSKFTTKYTYNKKGRVSTKMVYFDGEFDGRYTYKYDKKGRVTKETQWYRKNGKYKVLYYDKYTYSAKKNTITHYDDEDKMLNKTVNTLDSNKRVIKSVYKQYNNDGSVNYKETTAYTYWKNGKMKTEVLEGHFADIKVKYDKKGNAKSYEYENPDGDHYIEKYTYDSYGRLKKLETDTLSEFVGDSDEEFTPHTDVTTYKYSGYYKSKKYPTTIKEYLNGEYVCKTVRKYKSF